MRKKESGRTWYWLSLFVVAGAAILTGYYIGLEKGFELKEAFTIKRDSATNKASPTATPASPVPKVTIPIEKIKRRMPFELDYDCVQIERGVREFFQDLDTRGYIQRLDPKMDTYEIFRILMRKLSAKPPIPAGEGNDTSIMTRNIFHLSRALDKNELQMIREIIRNEADTLEIDFNLFFKWLMPDKECSDMRGIRPSFDVAYQYAGFLLNSIGGRSVLFRRSIRFRLLVSYYSLLIIHEADRKGKNSYGIDIFPYIHRIKQEMSLYPDFEFQEDYIQNLDELLSYYVQKRNR